ncbi:hypothetical protein F4556_006058 [Kitasatospora gansuensis]|uniref:Ricin B lectin domain-containing protein n=2 Tax=Kitasatospora TaxID=2063 RepID=A0A7W7SHE0_9ACTN|nr:hypothetical protein [Kitasatospora gansuensis]MBB4950523.1 hypothetical protein [Kitasatospora gansuensis]
MTGVAAQAAPAAAPAQVRTAEEAELVPEPFPAGEFLIKPSLGSGAVVCVANSRAAKGKTSVGACDPADIAQRWTYDPATQHLSTMSDPLLGPSVPLCAGRPNHEGLMGGDLCTLVGPAFKWKTTAFNFVTPGTVRTGIESTTKARHFWLAYPTGEYRRTCPIAGKYSGSNADGGNFGVASISEAEKNCPGTVYFGMQFERLPRN